MKIFKKVSIVVLIVAFTLGLAGSILALAPGAVDLGTADNFAVLAGSGITDSTVNAGIDITGDVGLHSTGGATIIGLTCAQVTGTIYDNDAGYAGGGGCLITDLGGVAILQPAKDDLVAAYAFAAAQIPTTTLPIAELGGTTQGPGVYDSTPGNFTISGGTTLTLDGGGDSDAVFIFQAASTLDTIAASNSVVLINGAQACNVFWQVGTSATLDTTTTFVGTIMAAASISDAGGSTVDGRLLADADDNTAGAVTLSDTTVTVPTCVVPPVPPPSQSSGVRVLTPPLISVEKIPTPLALPAGPGLVTYDYTVLNVGDVEMKDIQVADNKCSVVTFISGDINGDSLLGVSETWKYRCTTTLSETTTNTVTATGRANGFTAIDTANAIVVVGAPVIPPLIHLVKVPNVFLLPVGGGPVTYNYTVTNPGTEPLHDVSVIDDRCTGLPGRVVGHPGDLNQNNLLESNEAWSFTCQTYITQTTTNTGTAQGSANGLTVLDFALATVAVSIPGLPNTGLPPQGIAMIVGILMAVAVAFYFVRRKQTV